MNVEKFQKEVNVKTLDGEKKFTFKILTVEQAGEVFHNSISTIIRGLSNLQQGKDGSIDQTALLKVVGDLDYEQVKKLGIPLLKNLLVNDSEVGEFGKSEYFQEYPEEIYIAIFEAIKINYSGVFFRLKKKFKGFDLKTVMEKNSPNVMQMKQE